MSTWLRLTLITLTVGGGFMGTILTTQSVVAASANAPAKTLICILFLSINLFVMVSGLMLAQNPNRVVPIVVALALQVPVIYSPMVAYRLDVGLGAGGGLNEVGPFWWLRFGADWQFNLMQPMDWGAGVNLVALGFLILSTLSMRRLRSR